MTDILSKKYNDSISNLLKKIPTKDTRTKKWKISLVASLSVSKEKNNYYAELRGPDCRCYHTYTDKNGKTVKECIPCNYESYRLLPSDNLPSDKDFIEFTNKLVSEDVITPYGILRVGKILEEMKLDKQAIALYKLAPIIVSSSETGDLKYLAKAFQEKGKVMAKMGKKLDADIAFDMSDNLFIQYGKLTANRSN